MTLQAAMAPYCDGTFGFNFDDNTIYCQVANRLLTARRLTGQFPAYEAVLPKDHHIAAKVDAKQLRESLNRVGQFTDERSQAVKLIFKENELKLMASNTENGESEELLDIEYAGAPATIGFNVQFVIDVLKSMPENDRVSFYLKDAQSAAEIRPCVEMDPSIENRQVLMPCRVG